MVSLPMEDEEMEYLPMEDEEMETLAMEYDMVGFDSYRVDENVSRTRIFSVAQTVHLNSLYKSGMTSAAKHHRPLLEKALLTLQQVVVSYCCNWE